MQTHRILDIYFFLFRKYSRDPKVEYWHKLYELYATYFVFLCRYLVMAATGPCRTGACATANNVIQM